MARARNIKPAIFKNELLGVADPLITLLFQSLWTLADREGRLEDRPLRIKAETFPYRENLDVNGYLTELQRMGFIIRYSVNDLALIQVVNFKKHQTPHNTEKKSDLPEINDNSLIINDNVDLTVKNTLSNAIKTDVLPPDLLIPDSLLLIPDSIKTKTKTTPTATRLPIDWQPSEIDYLFAKQERPEINPRSTADQFRDYWIAKSGKDATKADWSATWRNWVRRQTATKQGYESAADKTRKTIEGLTGRASNEQRDFIDIN